MADSVATITINAYPVGVDNTQRNEIVRGKISLSAGRRPDGGWALDWSNVEGIKTIPLSGSSIAPMDIDVKSIASPPSGVTYLCDIASGIVGKLHAFISNNGVSGNSGPLVELGGTLPGWVINDSISFTAIFRRI